MMICYKIYNIDWWYIAPYIFDYAHWNEPVGDINSYGLKAPSANRNNYRFIFMTASRAASPHSWPRFAYRKRQPFSKAVAVLSISARRKYWRCFAKYRFSWGRYFFTLFMINIMKYRRFRAEAWLIQIKKSAPESVASCLRPRANTPRKYLGIAPRCAARHYFRSYVLTWAHFEGMPAVVNEGRLRGYLWRRRAYLLVAWSTPAKFHACWAGYAWPGQYDLLYSRGWKYCPMIAPAYSIDCLAIEKKIIFSHLLLAFDISLISETRMAAILELNADAA